MGLLSSIGKVFKKVWKGITKVFSKVTEAVGKLFSSKIGKALMLAVTVFSGGAALLAGGKGFMAGSGGFISKFLNGGKAFLNSLIGTKFNVEGAGGMGAATGGATEAVADSASAIAEDQALNVAEIMEKGGDALGGTEQVMGLADGGTAGIGEAALPMGGAKTTSGTGSLANAQNVLNTGSLQTKAGSIPLGQAAEESWLTKAAKAAKNFATSDLGKNIIGNAMQGYSQGQQIQAQLDHDRRYDKMWSNPNNPGMQALERFDHGVNVERGLAGKPGRFALSQARQAGLLTPTVTF